MQSYAREGNQSTLLFWGLVFKSGALLNHAEFKGACRDDFVDQTQGIQNYTWFGGIGTEVHIHIQSRTFVFNDVLYIIKI